MEAGLLLSIGQQEKPSLQNGLHTPLPQSKNQCFQISDHALPSFWTKIRCWGYWPVTVYIILASACISFAWEWRMSTGLNVSQSVRKCIKLWATRGETLRALGWFWRVISCFNTEEKEIAATEVGIQMIFRILVRKYIGKSHPVCCAAKISLD